MGSGNASFRPGLWPTLAFLPLLALLLGLGRWQLERADEKRALEAGIAVGALASPVVLPPDALPRHTRVSLSGRWDPTRQVLLDAFTHQGQAGYRVLTPLLRDTDIVLVDRGWVPAGADRRVLPDIALEARVVEVTGLTDAWPVPGLRAGDGATGTGWPRVLYFPTHAQLAALYDRPLHAQRVLLDADQPDGYERSRGSDGFGPERHQGYALTWFALALTLSIIYVAVNWRPRTE
jgi:surfeit locus 1 family protein